MKVKSKYSNYKKNWYKQNKERILKERKEQYYSDHEVSKEAKRDYYIVQKEKILKENKNWREVNKEQIKKRKKIYNQKTKSQRNTHNKERKKTEPLFKLKSNLRISILSSFKNKGFNKNSRTALILGCSFEEFKKYIESKFESWMSWDNHGKYNGNLNFGWDIDHIIPLCTAKNEEEIFKLNHYTNLQPLCSKFNREIKGGRL